MVIPADREGRNHDNLSLKRGEPITVGTSNNSRKAGGQKEDSGPQTVSLCYDSSGSGLLLLVGGDYTIDGYCARLLLI